FCIFECQHSLPMAKRRETVLLKFIRKTLTGLFFLVLSFFLCANVALAQDLGNLGEQKPFSLDGSITLSGTKYSVSGAPARRPPTSWTIVGTPTLSFYGVSLPFNFIL